MSNILSPEQLRTEWLDRLSKLIRIVQSWANAQGWATRQIEITLDDSQGKYKAPALLLQQETTRILLEPIAQSAPGTQGVVDLYLMPAYDDIASLYLYDDGWHLHYMFPGTPTVATISEAESKPLTKEALREVLEEMRKNAVKQV
jgi:hypothetical protein